MRLDDRPYSRAEVKVLMAQAEDALLRDLRREVYALYPSKADMPDKAQRRAYSDAVMAALRCIQ